MYKLDHKNIVKLHKHYEDENSVYLFMEYVDQGTLYDLYQPDRRLTEQEVVYYFNQILDAINYLHTGKKKDITEPIIHRDIKPENILITSKGVAKLADFGSSNLILINEARTTFAGTRIFMAVFYYLTARNF